ncbi:MAG: DDE-type integrase/transposase/recombinase [Kofleriaceae bacterium]|nr:DDE-type integrase/transposase/recombinase [Kofleriaceae bacterium]
MSQREQFVREWKWNEITRAALCAAFGISRQTGYSGRGVSRRAKHRREVTTTAFAPAHDPDEAGPPGLVAEAAVPLVGPVALRARLVEHWPHLRWPAPSTIGSILKKHGIVKPRRRRLRVAPRTRPFRACREANDVWCVDFKGQFETRDGRRCYPLTVMDAASRYLLACTALHHPTTANVKQVFVELFTKYGLPGAIRSDNGEPLASVSTMAGLTQLSAWAPLGIRLPLCQRA